MHLSAASSLQKLSPAGGPRLSSFHCAIVCLVVHYLVRRQESPRQVGSQLGGVQAVDVSQKKKRDSDELLKVVPVSCV